VQLAYAIGVADPVSVMVYTEGTGRIPEDRITTLVRDHFKLTPRGIIDELALRRPIYKKTAAFGHFGRTEPEFTWERTDKARPPRTRSAGKRATSSTMCAGWAGLASSRTPIRPSRNCSGATGTRHSMRSRWSIPTPAGAFRRRSRAGAPGCVYSPRWLTTRSGRSKPLPG